jgi:hypothetical protein
MRFIAVPVSTCLPREDRSLFTRESSGEPAPIKNRIAAVGPPLSGGR